MNNFNIVFILKNFSTNPQKKSTVFRYDFPKFKLLEKKEKKPGGVAAS